MVDVTPTFGYRVERNGDSTLYHVRPSGMNPSAGCGFAVLFAVITPVILYWFFVAAGLEGSDKTGTIFASFFYGVILGVILGWIAYLIVNVQLKAKPDRTIRVDAAGVVVDDGTPNSRRYDRAHISEVMLTNPHSGGGAQRATTDRFSQQLGASIGQAAAEASARKGWRINLRYGQAVVPVFINLTYDAALPLYREFHAALTS